MNPLITPTIHLNGTSREALAEQYANIMTAANALLDAIRAAAPNDRDYYPQGPLAGSRARGAMCARELEVIKLLVDFRQIAMEVSP
jgi:hypothetical protein